MVDTITAPHLLSSQTSQPPSIPRLTSSTLPQTTHGIPSSTRTPSYILFRPATLADLPGITDCFFTSFWPSHPFWTYKWPPRLIRPWLHEVNRIGLQDDDSMRTFVAIDTRVNDPHARNTTDGRIAGWTRWRIPQSDGNLNEIWPDLPDGLDMDAVGPLFAGMGLNRKELMGVKPHWFLQFLGTEVEYQCLGIGEAFVRWGCELADQEDLNVYIDASAKGGPFYQKHFGAVPLKLIDIPEGKEYGKLAYFSHVRHKMSEKENQLKGTEVKDD